MRLSVKSATQCGALLGLLLLSCAALALDRERLLDEANVLILPRERQLPEFRLTDENGQLVTRESLQNHWTLLFFGYTACPDVCPTTLSDMRQLLGQLPEAARERLQLILVSADPARDTPEVLRNYLGYYRAGFKGLTGNLADLQLFSKGLGLPFVPVAASEAGTNYSVSHSGNLAIVGPDATLRGHIRAPIKIPGLRRALPALIESE